MALDGAFLNLIKTELEQYIGARVDRIHQPSKEEILLFLRWRGGSGKLLISANANNARIHMTQFPPENPKVPPMFCMLLRKHLGGAKLIGIRQLELDRIFYLDFETSNELGDRVPITIAVEIMGRHSNIIVIDNQGNVLDAVKRVDSSMSGVRTVLPGLPYTNPPLQSKLNLLKATDDEILYLMNAASNKELSKLIMQVLQGISPILSREMAHFVTGGEDISFKNLNDRQRHLLIECLNKVRGILKDNTPKFTVLLENGKPKDFSFLPITQYGGYLQAKQFDSAADLLDYFFAERDRVNRMKQRSHDLLRMLANSIERVSRKLEIQSQELKQSINRDEYKIFGELLNANLYRFEKGQKEIVLENFYENNKPVLIPLDSKLPPAKNAQKYYNEYKKAANAEKMLTELTRKTQQELEYLESVYDSVSRTRSEGELLEIREELAEQGYLKTSRNHNKMIKPLPPLQYRSSDGFRIWCGRNNKQNDQLTMKRAKNYDMWCHTKDIPGSHVIIESSGEEIPNRTIEEACIIAATNSKASESSQVPVDFTLIKYVKKPVGAKPGMVIFTNQQTAFVNPDPKLEQMLLVKS